MYSCDGCFNVASGHCYSHERYVPLSRGSPLKLLVVVKRKCHAIAEISIR